MAQVVTFLSEAPDALGSALEGVGAYNSLTTIHTVPAGEFHEVYLVLTNMSGSVTIEVLGDMGAAVDSFDIRIPIETTESLGPFLMLGGSTGTTLALSCVANQTSLRVSGTVRIHS